MHGTRRRHFGTVLQERLKTRPIQVGEQMAVLDRFLAARQVADHLDDVKVARVGVRAFDHDVAQTQHVHAHRPDLCPAADDGDKGKT